MKPIRIVIIGLAVLATVAFSTFTASGAEQQPHLSSFSLPAAGDMQIIFRGTSGPFRIQTTASLEPPVAWVDVANAVVTELQPGVFMGLVPSPKTPVNLSFYRVVSEGDPAFELKGWTILLRVSTPNNGTHFVQGESPVVTVSILDTLAQGLGFTTNDFSTLNLYAYGPEDPLKAVTPVKLLNATADRTMTPHHFINLLTNPDAKVDGTTLTYSLKPVTENELPGTYTLGVRAVLKSDEIQQLIKYARIQIGNNTEEHSVVNKAKCAVCHEGPISGKIYMHHVDPSRSPVGSWSYDFEPVTSCKLCHNNDGYASFSVVTPTSTNRVPDHIVLRVHGVHMGEGLKLPFNTNQVNGNFRDYTDLAFPADVRNCTTCHADDRWKTQPSRMACGSCHDNIWFGAKPAPEGWVMHDGSEQKDDTKCSVCHAKDQEAGGLFMSVVEAHQVPPPPMNAVDVALTPLPANGKYYDKGEKPVVSIVIKNDATNSIGDHTVVNSANFSAASLFVYGPRSLSVPVLTSTAKLGADTKRASVTSSKAGPWDINGKTFKLAINGTAPQNITIVGASSLVTAAEVVAALNPVITNLNGGAIASVSGANVNIKTLIRGANARIEIYNGDVTTAMGWKAPGVVLEPDVTIAAVSTAGNDLRPVTDPLEFNDPNVTRTTTNILYQLDDVAGLASGTYCAFVYYVPKDGKVAGLTNWSGIGLKTFQVGTATAEKRIAVNCADCHGNNILHLYDTDPTTGKPVRSSHVHPAPFDVDYCKACHDYGHAGTGDMFKNQGGTSLNGWSGFGAMPIVRRVHGVHYAHYLEHPEEIYANATPDTFGGIIFPQDVRNCTKCHAESDTWKQKPSRMTCLACHDSDDAKAHGKLMTFMPDPNDPYGPTAVETCELCHGAGAEFSPDKVHSISKPYVPPYPREPQP